MNEEKIRYKDSFLGEIELRSVGRVILDAFHNTETYFIHTDERFIKRGLESGIYVRNDQDEDIRFISGKQIEMAHKIYELLTRIY
jgi:hypothetical protein